jgi:hypothetical protein
MIDFHTEKKKKKNIIVGRLFNGFLLVAGNARMFMKG